MRLKRACKEGIRPQYIIKDLGMNIVICIIEKYFHRSDFLFRKKWSKDRWEELIFKIDLMFFSGYQILLPIIVFESSLRESR